MAASSAAHEARISRSTERWSPDRLLCGDDELTPIWVSVDLGPVPASALAPRRQRWKTFAGYGVAVALGALAVLLVVQRDTIASWARQVRASTAQRAVAAPEVARSSPSLDLFEPPRVAEPPRAVEIPVEEPDPIIPTLEPVVMAAAMPIANTRRHRRLRRAAGDTVRPAPDDSRPAERTMMVVTSLDGPVTVREHRLSEPRPEAQPVETDTDFIDGVAEGAISESRIRRRARR